MTFVNLPTEKTSNRFFQAVLVLSLLISTTFSFAANGEDQPKSTYTLKLIVSDLYDNPIEEAVVFIGNNFDTERVTNSQGVTTYTLSAGNYTINSYAPNYLDYENLISITDSDITYQVRHAQAVQWSTSPSDAPVGVGANNGLRLAAAGTKVYFWAAFGGEPGITQKGSLADFYAYDTQTDIWSQLPDAPFASSYGISTAWGKNTTGEDAIYLLKGYYSGQRTWFTRYNTESNHWESSLNHNIPWRTDLGNQYSGTGFQNYPRNGAAMVYSNDNYIYLFPGSGYGYENYDWYRYSVATDQWEDMGALPHKQGPGNAAVWVDSNNTGLEQDYIYVQFGISPSGNYTAAEFWRYGLTTGTWENMADHAFGADDGSALVYDGNNYIFHTPGAWAEQTWDKANTQKRQFLRYSISTNQWEEMEKTPYNRWGGWDDAGGMVIVGNTIYAMKGGDDVAWAEDYFVSGGGDISSNQFWKYTINPELYELKVILHEGMGSINLPQDNLSYPKGTTVEFLATPQEGWAFKEWIVNGDFYSDQNPNFLVMNEDKSLKAIFTLTSTVVSLNQEQTPQIYAHKKVVHLQLPIEGSNFSLFDLYGRKLYTVGTLSAGNHQLNVDLSSGIYIARISLGGRFFTVKIHLSE